jgi:hypothetical protein
MSNALATSEKPSKWIDIIYNVKSFIDIIELTSPMIRHIIEEKGISEIVSEDFILSFDFSIQKYQPGWVFGFPNRFKDVETIFELKDATEVLNKEDLLEFYVDEIMDKPYKRRFMHIDNFCFSKDRTKVATKNFRILIDDLSGKVPRDELLHIASIASLMLSGKLEYTIGYDYICDIMKKYGYTKFTFQENGYLHIDLGNRLKGPKYKGTGGNKYNPKS